MRITTASSFSQSINDVPGTVTVITADEIKRYGLRTLVDVLNMVPGFQTFATTFATWDVRARRYSHAYATIRVMVDGRPLNESYNRQISAFESFPLDNVKQIEIIRGPGSSLSGTDAFSGVVNIITDKRERSVVSTTMGENGYYGVNAAQYADVSEDLSYSLTVDYSNTDGDPRSYETDFLSGTGMSQAPHTRYAWNERLGVSGSVRYKDWTLTLLHADYARAWTAGYVNIQSPGDERVESVYSYADLQYLHEFFDETSVEIRGSYDRNTTRFVGQLFPPGFDWGPLRGMADINGDGVADNWPDGASYDSKLEAHNASVQLFLRKVYGAHQVLLGGEWGNETIGDVSTQTDVHHTFLTRIPYDTYTTRNPIQGLPSVFMIGEGEEESHYAVLAQDIVALGEDVTFVVGARHDEYDDTGGSFSPRAALIWNVFPSHILKASYGKAFFSPPNGTKYNNTFGYFGQPDLKPQTIQTVELAFQNLYESALYYAVVLYGSEIDDFIETDRNINPSFFNAGEARFSGVEVEVRWRISDAVSMWGNYSFADGYFVETGLEYDGVEHMGNLGVSARVTEDLVASVHAQLVGEGQRGTGDLHSEPVDSYTPLNLALVFTGIPNTVLTLSAHNLFDEKYFSPNDITSLAGLPSHDFPNEGRQVLLKATYEW
ncbi:MAG: TonB-dependent receptor [Lentisphaerae bacterium]|nr:TonB-dependent receptor [Lentisphaerota bacterium]